MTTCFLPKDLLSPRTSIANSLIVRALLEPDVDRLPGTQPVARRLGPRLDEEHELRALVARIEDRRRVLRLARHERDLRRHWRGTAVAHDLDRLADLHRTERRLRNVEAHLDVARRQQRGHRASRGHPFAFDEEGVLHQRARWRRDALLLQAPGGLRERRLRRRDLGLGRFELAFAPQRLQRGLELRLGFLDARRVAVARAAGVVEARLGAETFLEELLLARERGDRQLERRASLVHLLAQRGDFGLAARALQVLQARLRAFHPLLGFSARGALGLLLEREKRLAGIDAVAAAHEQLLQLPGVGRSNQHELAFDVALQRAV